MTGFKPLVYEATALPTKQQTLPNSIVISKSYRMLKKCEY